MDATPISSSRRQFAPEQRKEGREAAEVLLRAAGIGEGEEEENGGEDRIHLVGEA